MTTTEKIEQVLKDNNTSVNTLWKSIEKSDNKKETFDFFLKHFMSKAYNKAEFEYKEKIKTLL